MIWLIGQSGCGLNRRMLGLLNGTVLLKVMSLASAAKDRLNVEEFVASEAAFAEDRGKLLFEAILSNVIAQMDAESLEVFYPAPIADGFNAPAIEEHGSTMYRINQPNALSDSFDSIPNLLHNQSQSLSQGIRSHHIFWYTDGF